MGKHQARLLAGASTLTFMAALLAAPVAAQDTDNDFQIDEIVVTAQKRSERLLDVPISVAAISEKAITNTGVQRISELAEQVPNVYVPRADNLGGAIIIRGVGANSRNIGFDTRVGVYLDGVYLGQSPALNQDLVDLERVEVLRGPQGALFGKNTVAGAVNMISKKPSGEFEGEIKAKVGNFGLTQFSGRVNIPLSDQLAVKLSASKLDRNGFVGNAFGGDSVQDRDSFSYRAQVRFDATEDLQFLLSIDGLDADQIPHLGEPLTGTFGNPILETSPNRSTNIDFPGSEVRDIFGISLDTSYNLGGDFTLKSITSYRDTNSQIAFDVDYSPLDFMTIDYSDDYEQFTEELQLISPEGETLDYIIGLYYFEQNAETARFARPGSVVPFQGWPTGDVISTGTLDTQSFAIFANANYDITDRLHLGVGFRWSTETKDVNWLLDGSQSGVFFIGSTNLVDSRNDKDFAPSLSLNYDFSDDLVGYLRYAEGYKSGGYNLDFVTNADIAAGVEFDKETVRNFEAGIKGQLMDNKLQFNIAAFYTEFDNYQVNQFVDLGEGRTSISIRNAAKVETKGAELALTAYFSENFSMSGSLGVLDASFASFPGGGAGGADVTGNDLPLAPEFQASVGADYYTPIEGTGLNLTAHVDYTYTSSAFNTVDNVRSASATDPATGNSANFNWGFADARALVNARLSIGDEDETWELSLWARNLFNNDYVANTNRDFFGTLTAIQGDPRTYGLELSYRF